MTANQILDARIFAVHQTPMRDVIRGGAHVIVDGHHAAEEAVARDYVRTLERLLA